MARTVLFCLAAAFVLVACGKKSTADKALFGTWAASPVLQEDQQFTLVMQITDSNVTFIGECLYPSGFQLQAQVTVPAYITSQTLSIEAGDRDYNQVESQSCYVSAVPGEVSYQVSGKSLILINTITGQKESLTRRQ